LEVVLAGKFVPRLLQLTRQHRAAGFCALKFVVQLPQLLLALSQLLLECRDLAFSRRSCVILLQRLHFGVIQLLRLCIRMLLSMPTNAYRHTTP
jgi:hypothetical protein